MTTITDKKLTNNEIVKALEGDILNAEQCDSKVWSIEVYKLENYFDLIKRQEAEIERLKIDNQILSINADNAFQEGLNEAQDLYAEQIKEQVKSEAIKEFWNQRPPQLNPTQKGKELYNEGWNDCISFFAEEYKIFLGPKQYNEKYDCDETLVKEMVGNK